jgi:pimeloyl-ACP methyl ester carboxylesterase
MEMIPLREVKSRRAALMSRKKTRLQVVSRRTPPGGEQDAGGKQIREQAQLVSGRWLFLAVCWTVAAAATCGWLVLCLLFWQGSWQLLYRPAAAVARTPASVGLAFDSVEFAAIDAGAPRLKGWWIPAANGAAFSRFTVLYLHGQNGNLGDAVDALARLHAVGVNVLAFDYRGYGESQFARPSESHWRQDAEWAIQYLTGTRHIDAETIVLDGTGLGANLALEVSAVHPEVAGVVLDSPLAAPMNAIFNDARARLVPARLLMRDRYDLDAAAGTLRVPLLWFERAAQPGNGSPQEEPTAFRRVAAHKMFVWMNPSKDSDKQYEDALSRWLDELRTR